MKRATHSSLFSRYTFRAAIAVAFVLATACASDLRDQNDGGVGLDVDAAFEPTVETLTIAGGFETRVNSSDFDTWIYISFESGAANALVVGDESLEWDVAFKRFQIKLNGGVSGAGGGELAVQQRASFADVTTEPIDGYVTDMADSPEDEDDDDELAFETAEEGWYDYDPESHVLSPKSRAYVVRGADPKTVVVLELIDYYNDAGSSGRFTIHWKAL